MGFLIFLPIVLAMIGIIIGFLAFIGICLLIIGITGIVMNRLYIRQMKEKIIVSKPLLNVSSIILGFIFILFPFGYLLYTIISSFPSK